MIDVKDSKSQLIQFNRQLDYGIFGGSAQHEGGIGEEDTSNYVRHSSGGFTKTTKVSDLRAKRLNILKNVCLGIITVLWLTVLFL